MNDIQRSNAIWTESLAMLKFMLPTLAHYIQNKGGGEPGRAPDDAEYLRTITDEQLEAMRARVPPEQFADLVERVRAARAAAQPPSTSTPAAPPTASTPSLQPLQGDAKIGAIKLLGDVLLPAVTKRFLAGQPLIDPATDDLRHYHLLKRLAISVEPNEAQMVFNSLPPDCQRATLALLDLMKLEFPGINSGRGAAS